MDVTNLTTSSSQQMGKDSYQFEKYKNRLSKVYLRKTLLQIKQSLAIGNRASHVSLEASTKIALAESYIRNGKLIAAKEVIKEVSGMIFVKPKIDDSRTKSSYIPELKQEEISVIKSQDSSTKNSFLKLNEKLESEKKDMASSKNDDEHEILANKDKGILERAKETLFKKVEK